MCDVGGHFCSGAYVNYVKGIYTIVVYYFLNAVGPYVANIMVLFSHVYMN